MSAQERRPNIILAVNVTLLKRKLRCYRKR